jgi:predicted nucleic acid-binding protein
MKYLLDTDTLIYFMKGRPSVVEAFGRVNEEELCTSILNHSELLYGAFYSEQQKQNLKKIYQLFEYIDLVPYDEEASQIFAEQKVNLRKNGIALMDFDLMIGSVALRHELILVSNNQKHFEKIPGLQLENWA